MNDPFAHLPSAQPELSVSSPRKGSNGRGATSEPCPATLAEARLLAAWYRQNDPWLAQKLKAMLRYRDWREWTSEKLRARRDLLSQDIRTLRTLLDQPDETLCAEGWTGPKWWQMFRRLRGWLGHLDGLDEACQNRK